MSTGAGNLKSALLTIDRPHSQRSAYQRRLIGSHLSVAVAPRIHPTHIFVGESFTFAEKNVIRQEGAVFDCLKSSDD